MSSLCRVRSALIVSSIIFQNFFCLAQDAPASHLVLPEKGCKVPFVWKADSINGQWDEYAAMLIPIQLPGCSRKFYMQFDAGAPYSLFYKNKLKAISSHYPKSVHLPDSAVLLKEFRFVAGKTSVLAREIPLRQLGTDEITLDQNNVEIIGTLGTDFIGTKTVIIDYPGKNISIGYEVPANTGIIFTDFIYANQSIILPVSLRGKKTMLYFDSGSSAFELLTSKETAIALALPGSTPVTYPVTSWSKTLTAISYTSADSIEIASAKLPLNKVTYVEGAGDAQVNRMMKMGIGGLTGNKLFLHAILVLDIKNRKFGILPHK